jgi:acyl-CoA synthetase (AMP-forming)/AMP-acid ligase II
VGATSILWPGAPAPQHVYAVIEAHRPTLFFSVPTSYGMLLGSAGRSRTRQGPDFDLSSIRLAVSAGEALPAALYERFKERFGVDIIDGIGSTEVLHMFISNRPGAIRPGSSGQLVRGYEARLLDESGQPTPPARSATCGSPAIRSAPRTGTSTRRPRPRSKGAGSAPATSTRRTLTATTGTRAGSTTCSRSAACGSARWRSRTRSSRTRQCSSVAWSAARITTAW